MTPPESNARQRRSTAVTIRHVAAEAKVSTATVSRVLSGPNGVTKSVRERVMRAVGKLDYHPNYLARDLRAGLRKVIGVVIPDLQNPFLTGVVHGVEEILHRNGYTLVLGNSEGQASREQKYLSVLRGEGAAGVILIPGNSADANYDSLGAWDIPVVAVDRMPAGLEIDLVRSGNYEGARDAINHLIGHGYKDIAIINGPEGVSTAKDRLTGYLEALRGAKIEPRHSFIIHSDFRQAGGCAAMRRLLDLPRPPKAVFVANNLMTLGALQAIHERGLEIPEQIALVGFDDMPWAISLRPPLTAVAQPSEEIGRVAAQLLLERLQAPQRLPRQVVLPTQLIVRSSCGCRPSPPAKDLALSENKKEKTQPR